MGGTVFPNLKEVEMSQVGEFRPLFSNILLNELHKEIKYNQRIDE
jgi:hypothetical protein